jgi:5-methylcytosine-specific restriction endonuclease McrA
LASYHKHKEKHKAMGKRSKEVRYAGRRKYYEKHYGDLLAKTSEWKLANYEKNKSTKRYFYERTREAHIKRAAKYHRDNPDKANKYRRIYRRKYPEKTTADKQNRRTRVTNGGGKFSAQEWYELKLRYGFSCLCCGGKEPNIKLSADHIVPVSKGGSSFIDNIQPLCKSCNSRKYNKIIDYRPQSNGLYGDGRIPMVDGDTLTEDGLKADWAAVYRVPDNEIESRWPKFKMWALQSQVQQLTADYKVALYSKIDQQRQKSA